MNHWAWHLRRLALRLGMPGLAGLALLLISGASVLWLLQPLQRDLAAQTDKLRGLQARHHLLAVAASPARPGPLAWVRTLPRPRGVPAVMGQLAELARAQGLALDQGQYSVAPVTGTSLLRWRARMPVTGDYRALRAFLATSLQTFPALSLDAFKLERQDIGAQTVQADLRFSLILRSGP